MYLSGMRSTIGIFLFVLASCGSPSAPSEAPATIIGEFEGSLHINGKDLANAISEGIPASVTFTPDSVFMTMLGQTSRAPITWEGDSLLIHRPTKTERKKVVRNGEGWELVDEKGVISLR